MASKKKLWQKERIKKFAYFVNYFDDLETDFADLDEIFEISKPAAKSNTISSKLREEGNIEFAAKNWTNAIKAYNYALCFAENESEALSQAYANRSACFFELDQFESCHKDIELALQSSKCTKKLKKLIFRHQKDCADFIQNIASTDNTNVGPKLDFKPNEQWSALANVLQIENRVTAGCDINVGQRIIAETSFVRTLMDDLYMRCCICSKHSNNLIPCSKCTEAMFCSGKCEQSILHKAECNFSSCMQSNLKDDGKLAFLTRTVLHAISLFNNVFELMTFVMKNVAACDTVNLDCEMDEQSKYAYFLNLKSDPKIARGDKFDPIIYFAYKAIMASDLKKMFTGTKPKRFLVHLIWQHEAIISLGHIHQYTNRYNQIESLHLFLTFSLFSHSCTPNAMWYIANDVLIVEAMRPIQKGEEIMISYFGRNCFIDSENERQEYLKCLADNFQMDCSCDLCKGIVASTKDREIFTVDPLFQYILGSLYNRNGENLPMNVEEAKNNAIDFMKKFGRSKWCTEIGMVAACLMDMTWLQSNTHL